MAVAVLAREEEARPEGPMPDTPGAPRPEQELPDPSEYEWQTCTLSGDPHFRSFDNVRFDFHGIGTFVVLKNKRVTVQAKFVACGSRTVSCLSAIVVVIGLNKAIIEYDRTERQIRLDGAADMVELKSVSTRTDLMDGDTFVQYQSGSIVIGSYKGDGPQITMRSSMLTVTLPKESDYLENTEGLCGVMNGDPTDDFTPFSGEKQTTETAKNTKYRNGEVNTFGQSWSACKDITEGTTECNCRSLFFNEETSIQPEIQMTPENYEFSDGELEKEAMGYCSEKVGYNEIAYDNCMFDVATIGKLESEEVIDDVDAERLITLWEGIGIGIGIVGGVGLVGAVLFFGTSTVYFSNNPERLPFGKKRDKIAKELDQYGVLSEEGNIPPPGHPSADDQV